MTLADLSTIVPILATMAQDASSAAETVAANPDKAARGFRFLIGAYTIVWTILAIYLLSLSVRLRRLSLQVRRIKDKLGLG